MNDSAGRLPAVVSTQWLDDRLDDPHVQAVDASWYLPGGRDAEAEFLAGHIPGAVRVDLERVSAKGTDLPHMLPTPAEFAAEMGALGIDDEDTIVVYDASGVNLSAPRIWWMFRTFGHARTVVLDGGLRQWIREGRPVEPGPARARRGHFSARIIADRVLRSDDVLRRVERRDGQIVDARSAGRFAGTEPEPRPGLRSGHIPGSRNVPFTSLVGPGGLLRPPGELRDLFREAGLDLDRPILASCGSGVTACAVVLALEVAGHPDAPVYDGSWSEWGRDAGSPIETGPPSPISDPDS